MSLQPWGKTYQTRTRSRHVDGTECVVCGKRIKGDGVSVACSPARGTFVDAAIVGTPEGDAIEASGYLVGSDCARQVRAEHPNAITR